MNHAQLRVKKLRETEKFYEEAKYFRTKSPVSFNSKTLQRGK